MPNYNATMPNYSAFPKPFDEIIGRIVAERSDIFDSDPIISAVPIRLISRKYNTHLQFELRFPKRRWRGYIKVRKPTKNKNDPDRPAPGVCMQREFELLRRLDNLFGNDSAVRTIRPIACYAEYPAMITEEAPGRDGVTELKKQVGVFSATPTQEMERVCFLCGEWLSKFQKETAGSFGETFSLDKMREYNDRRLRYLVKHQFLGFGEAERIGTLRFFDSLAESVAERDQTPVGVHADFSLGNMLVSGSNVVVMDFEMVSVGLPFHDVAFFYHNIHNLAFSGRFRRGVLQCLGQRFLDGYRMEFDVSAPLFRMFQLQHILCNLSSMASQDHLPLWKRLYHKYSYYGRLRRHHFKWLREQCEV